jgi:hypothetical protein
VSLTFPTLRDFRAAHAIRGRGPELDYGEPWLTGRFGPAYRAAWLRATGELFAVRLGPQSAGGGAVELLAHVPDGALLDEMLRGWRDTCGTFDSMRWLRARVARAHPLKRRHGWALAA